MAWTSNTAVCTPTIDGAGEPRSGQSAETTPKRAAMRSSPCCDYEGHKNHRPKICRNRIWLEFSPGLSFERQEQGG